MHRAVHPAGAGRSALHCGGKAGFRRPEIRIQHEPDLRHGLFRGLLRGWLRADRRKGQRAVPGRAGGHAGAGGPGCGHSRAPAAPRPHLSGGNLRHGAVRPPGRTGLHPPGGHRRIGLVHRQRRCRHRARRHALLRQVQRAGLRADDQRGLRPGHRIHDDPAQPQGAGDDRAAGHPGVHRPLQLRKSPPGPHRMDQALQRVGGQGGRSRSLLRHPDRHHRGAEGLREHGKDRGLLLHQLRRQRERARVLGLHRQHDRDCRRALHLPGSLRPGEQPLHREHDAGAILRRRRGRGLPDLQRRHRQSPAQRGRAAGQEQPVL